MFSKERIHRLAPDVMFSIEAELLFWKESYPNRSFFQKHIGFEQYVPTLRFGYDAYLLYHREYLPNLLPTLRLRYDAMLTEKQRVRWEDAALIVGATWARLGGGEH